jgi:hypothetical protein
LVLIYAMKAQSVDMRATAERLAEALAALAEEAQETRARAQAACDWAARVVAASERCRAERGSGSGGRLTGR